MTPFTTSQLEPAPAAQEPQVGAVFAPFDVRQRPEEVVVAADSFPPTPVYRTELSSEVKSENGNRISVSASDNSLRSPVPPTDIVRFALPKDVISAVCPPTKEATPALERVN